MNNSPRAESYEASPQSRAAGQRWKFRAAGEFDLDAMTGDI
jgi:hypothetical protein